MSGFLDKVSGVFFRDEDPEEMEEQQYSEPEAERAPMAMPHERNIWNEREGGRAKKANLVSVPASKGNASTEMVLIKASSYDDLQVIASHIKDRRVVVVNFEEMDKAVAQRLVDFLSSAVFSLDGQPKKVSGGTFIFSSNRVDLSGQIMDNDDLPDTDFERNVFKPYTWLKK